VGGTSAIFFFSSFFFFSICPAIKFQGESQAGGQKEKGDWGWEALGGIIQNPQAYFFQRKFGFRPKSEK